MIKRSPQKTIANGTDCPFLNDLRRELKRKYTMRGEVDDVEEPEDDRQPKAQPRIKAPLIGPPRSCANIAGAGGIVRWIQSSILGSL